MPEDTPKTFMEHTEELGKRLKIVILTFIVSTAVMMILPANTSFLQNPLEQYEPFVAVILRSIREHVVPPGVTLIGLELAAPIELYVVASILFASIFTMPVLAYEVYKFVDPALLPNERRDVYPFTLSVTVLFIIGAAFGLGILAPFFIQSLFPFFGIVGAEPVISITNFYNILFVTTLVTGAVFTFPAFFFLLVKYGIVGTEILRKNRKYLYVALLILAMAISPGSSPQGNLLLFLPMVILVEAGIFFAHRYEKKNEIKRVSWFRQKPTCKFCGTELPSSSVFCLKCGRSQS